MLLDPRKIVLCYTLLGIAWIFFSDRLTMAAFHDAPDILLRISTYKGFAFVVGTALLLHLLLSAHARAYRRKQRELLESQERYRLVVESVPDAILIHDGTAYVFANAAATRLFGAGSPERLLGLPVLDLVHEDSRASVRERTRRVVEDGTRVDMRTERYRRLDGTPLDVEGGAMPFPVDGRNGVVVFLRDIGQQMAAERSLRESEAKYRLLADNAHDLIFTLDPALRVTYVSPSVHKLRGVTVEQAMEQSVAQVMTPASFAKVRAVVERLPGEGAMDAGLVERMELEFYRQDGSTVWVETVVRPMLDETGRFLGFVGVSRDITERRAAEEERNRSRIFLTRILSTIPDPVFVKDANHRFVLVNEALCLLVGLADRDMLGKRDEDFMPQDEAEAFVAHDDIVLATGGEDIAEERITDSLGRPRILVTKKRRFDDPMGQAYIVGVIRDVTEDKIKEGQLRDSLLEKEVLLKEVHHRVKNNLQIISSLLYLQKEGVEDPDIQGLFEESRNRIGSMALVHEELYRSGDLGRVDLVEYLERLGPKVIQSLRGQKRLELALALAPCRLPVDKAIPFGLIVNELLTNAVKHGFAGRETGMIRVTVEAGEGQVRAVVEDDGSGLPAGFHPESSKSLGMQLVVQLTRQLRGSLTFGSGRGTVFRLHFPLVDTPE